MKKQLWAVVLFAFVMLTAAPVQAETNSLQDEVLYNVLIDRFNNGDVSLDEAVDVADPAAYHGGDFKGIVKKLDTLKNLGISTIVLSPPMANASKGYHGYWVEDFTSVEPEYGTMEDFKTLITEAHDRDMKVVMEFVMNYAADTHPLADSADKTFVKDEVVDAPWGEGAVVLDQSNQEIQDLIKEAARFWMEKTDLDGYKLHAADQANAAFLQELTGDIKSKNDQFILLADVLDADSDISNLEDNPDIDAFDDPNIQEGLADSLSEPGQSMTPLVKATDLSGRHLLYADGVYTKRFSQLVAENGRNELTSWKLALTYMYTAPGLPSLLQGSEIPMYGDGWPETQKLVQFNQQDADTKEFYEKISAIHEQFPVLSDGTFDFVGEEGSMTVYKRSNSDQTIYVALNNSVQSQKVSIEELGEDKQLTGILGDNIVRQNDDGEFNLILPRETAEIYIVEDNTGLNWPFILFVGGVFILFLLGIIVTSRKQKQKQKEDHT